MWELTLILENKRKVIARFLNEETLMRCGYKHLSVRSEARTLAMLSETRLISLLRIGKINDLESAYLEVLTALNKVDPMLTIYSQIEKRNISRKDFENEVQELRKLYVNAQRPS